MADSKVFKLSDNVSVEGIAEVVEAILQENKKLYVERIEVVDGFLIKAREEDKIKNLVGMGLATQVQIIPSEDTVTVNIGSGKWIDKAGLAAVGAWLFFPLAVTAGIGAWNQKKLPEDIFNAIDNYVVGGGRQIRQSRVLPGKALKMPRKSPVLIVVLEMMVVVPFVLVVVNLLNLPVLSAEKR